MKQYPRLVSGLIMTTLVAYVVVIYPTASESPNRHLYFAIMLGLFGLSFARKTHPIAFYLSLLPVATLSVAAMPTVDHSAMLQLAGLLFVYGPGGQWVSNMYALSYESESVIESLSFVAAVIATAVVAFVGMTLSQDYIMSALDYIVNGRLGMPLIMLFVIGAALVATRYIRRNENRGEF